MQVNPVLSFAFRFVLEYEKCNYAQFFLGRNELAIWNLVYEMYRLLDSLCQKMICTFKYPDSIDTWTAFSCNGSVLHILHGYCLGKKSFMICICHSNKHLINDILFIKIQLYSVNCINTHKLKIQTVCDQLQTVGCNSCMLFVLSYITVASLYLSPTAVHIGNEVK